LCSSYIIIASYIPTLKNLIVQTLHNATGFHKKQKARQKANVGGLNISAENCGSDSFYKRGIKYFRGVQKFQAKVVWGSTF